MSEDNKEILDEQLIKCVLDDKLPIDKKLKKMDYIIKLGADVNADSISGYSVLELAKIEGDDVVVSFLIERGARETEFDKKELEQFFKIASVEEINKFLRELPDGYRLKCDVDLRKRNLTKLPDFSKVIIVGNFDCSFNSLETLEGAPNKIRKNFDCDHNQLKSLIGAPKKVGYDFCCENNQLTSLEGAPTIIYGNFNCSNNQLITLKGAPREVDKSFICKNNLLECLTGAPVRIGADFFCDDNPLKSMKGMPEDIRGEFFHRSDVMFMKKGNGRIDS